MPLGYAEFAAGGHDKNSRESTTLGVATGNQEHVAETIRESCGAMRVGRVGHRTKSRARDGDRGDDRVGGRRDEMRLL
jgi:hypothetical protein